MIKKLLRSIPFMAPVYNISLGVLSNVYPGIFSIAQTGGTISARYCYSVWLRHLTHLYKCGMNKIPNSIAELGPGDSVGIGLSAMLSGTNKYYALDVVSFADISRNETVFNELIDLFNNRTPIPDDNEFPRVKPKLNDYGFPSHILSDEHLNITLHPKRLQKIRSCISGKKTNDEISINYIAPWLDYVIAQQEDIDLIYSQAVLEHVDDLVAAYKAMKSALRSGGYISHTIDFKCHNSAFRWNGHYAYSDKTWRIIRGNRNYFLNREPLTTHKDLIQSSGFDILEIEPTIMDGGIKLSKAKRKITSDDLAVSSVYIAGKK